MPNLFIIAGPNGAYLAIAAYTLLPDMLNAVEYVNADGMRGAYRRPTSGRWRLKPDGRCCNELIIYWARVSASSLKLRFRPSRTGS